MNVLSSIIDDNRSIIVGIAVSRNIRSYVSSRARLKSNSSVWIAILCRQSARGPLARLDVSWNFQFLSGYFFFKFWYCYTFGRIKIAADDGRGWVGKGWNCFPAFVSLIPHHPDPNKNICPCLCGIVPSESSVKPAIPHNTTEIRIWARRTGHRVFDYGTAQT